MAKFKGLGKGLDALLSAANVDVPAIRNNSDISAHDKLLKEINLNKIRPGKYQPRRIFDETELAELADSIRHNGVIQPIILRSIDGGNYEIIAGERRWRASQLVGLKTIPAVLREFSDEEALAISLIENIQRKDLNIVEEAQGYRRLIDEFGLTHEALAQVTGKSRSNISNTLRLLNLNPLVLDMLLQGQLDMGHARALLSLSHEDQLAMAELIITQKLTTAEVEKRVAQILQGQNHNLIEKASPLNKDPDISRLEETIADKIGMMVNIKHSRGGNGKLTINYSSVDELEGLLEHFND